MGPGSRDEFDSQGSAAALEEGLMTGRGLRSRAPVAARDASLSPTRDGQGVGGVPTPVGGQPWDDSAYRWSAAPRPARRVLDEGGCATWVVPLPSVTPCGAASPGAWRPAGQDRPDCVGSDSGGSPGGRGLA